MTALKKLAVLACMNVLVAASAVAQQVNFEVSTGCAPDHTSLNPPYTDVQVPGPPLIQSSTATCFDTNWWTLFPDEPLPTYPPDNGNPQSPPLPTSILDQEDFTRGASNGYNGSGTEQCTNNPVEILGQNKYEVEVDFRGPGSLPLEVVRHYNSTSSNNSAAKGSFGQGWTTGIDEKIAAIDFPSPGESPATTRVLIRTSSGYQMAFSSTDGGPWETSTGTEVRFAYDSTEELFTWVDNNLV